jgi:hypothetical protein
MSSGSNGVDQVRSLQKMPMQLRLAILGVNGASSASFVLTFMQKQNVPKHPKTWVLAPTDWIGRVRCEKFWRDFV